MYSATDRPSVRRRFRLFPGHRMVWVGGSPGVYLPREEPQPHLRVELETWAGGGSKGDVAELVDDVRRRPRRVERGRRRRRSPI